MNETNGECEFCLDKYYQLLDNTIRIILSRQEKEVLTYDILETEKSTRNKLIILKEKQRQMKIGEIWEVVLGNYNGYVNLKIGHLKCRFFTIKMI
jgi:hypothetical protein